MNYDLEERTAKFGEDVIILIKGIKKDVINTVLTKQLVRSATSIGANYMEANQASSKRDFRNKIQISRKESNETKHWLRMLAKAQPNCAEKCRALWKEAHELTLILATISRKTSLNSKN